MTQLPWRLRPLQVHEYIVGPHLEITLARGGRVDEGEGARLAVPVVPVPRLATSLPGSSAPWAHRVLDRVVVLAVGSVDARATLWLWGRPIEHIVDIAPRTHNTLCTENRMAIRPRSQSYTPIL